ncbi:predicted transcriptional regulator, partial [Acidovorax sp. MR-S7]
MDGATARIWSSDKGRSERSTGEREAKRDASCMAFLLTKKKALSQICVDDRHSDGVEQELARL